VDIVSYVIISEKMFGELLTGGRCLGPHVWELDIRHFELKRILRWGLRRRQGPEALNDDLPSKFDDNINSTGKQLLLDCPNSTPDAILRIMFSGLHISVNWTI